MTMDSPTLPVAHDWWRVREIAEGITLITEPYVTPMLRCNVWHIRGSDTDMLVDTGLGLAPLRDGMGDLLDRDPTVVATHAHYDHVGGMYEFPVRVGHRSEAAMHIGEEPDPPCLLAAQLDPDELAHMRDAGYRIPEVFVTALPSASFDVTQHRTRAAALTRLVEEGEVIDLGDRCFEVLHLPGHSPGSIGLWEASTGILFSGDAVYDGPLLDQLPGSDVEAYRATMTRLRNLPVTAVHSGHDASFGRARLVSICDDYLART